ncbi:MAG: hypothetical protein CL910_15130 [Deltaproteobacteria bacterium]|nr:hypothetical protein [Deltaproteobacteria bacterium]
MSPSDACSTPSTPGSRSSQRRMASRADELRVRSRPPIASTSRSGSGTPMAELAGMDAGEIFAFLKDVMEREFDISPEEIRLESDFVEDLDMDSIDAVDLAVAVEEELGVQFETDDLTGLQVMRDVVDLIERKRAGIGG